MVSVPIWAFWTCIPIIFSMGLTIGAFGSKFVSKKDCQHFREEFWEKIEDCEKDRSKIKVSIASSKES